jgi:NAD(P)-dependent dehydrogenase (short-subunit alcohol dehydrogenase family)
LGKLCFAGLSRPGAARRTLSHMTTDRIALVTGANKGIGYEISRQLGAAGVTVIVGARDADRGRAAAAKLRTAGIGATAVVLDVTDEASIAAVAKWVDERYGRLDILVNNAGIALERGEKPSQVPLALVRRTYETNVFGLIAVTNAMLPLLRRSPAGRIVNLSSGLGSLANTTTPDTPYSAYPVLGYNSSKTAVNAVTVSYANELRGTAIKVNSADPGYCATDLNEHAGFRTAEQGARIAVRLALLPDSGPSGEFHDEDGPVGW